MRRHEAVALLAFGVLLLVAGVTWLAGGWGLAGSGGVVLVAALLFDFSDTTSKRGEGGT